MKKLCFALAICILASCFTLFAGASDDFEVVIVDGVPCVKDEIVLTTNVFYNPDDYTNAEGVDFLGICIVELDALFLFKTGEEADEELKTWQEKMGDIYFYCVTTDGKVSLKDAIKVLSEHETVTAAGPNAILYPADDFETYTASESPINKENVDVFKARDSFVSSTFELTFEEELDVSQFGGEEKGYLFGVGIENIEKIDSESGFSYIVTVDGKIDNALIKRAFESAEEVSEVKAFSTYGNGDVTGDGIVNTFDYIFVKRLCLATICGTVTQLGAADTNLDGTVGALDYILIKRQVLGTYSISNDIVIP